MWELGHKEGWVLKIDAFELWCWRRLLRVPWTARRSNQSILKEITSEYSLEELMLKLKLQYFGHLMRTADFLEKTLILGKIEGRRRRGWQWMASLTQWTWVRVNSGRWQRTGKLSMLQSMGSQRVRHDWVTEQPPPQAAEPESVSPGFREVGVALHCSTACLHCSFQQSISPVIGQDELGKLWKIPFLSGENFVFEMNVAHSKYYRWINFTWGLPLWLSCKESVYNAGDMGLIPGSGRSLEKEMATHSITLAWEISWTEEPRRLQSMGLQRVCIT